MRDRLENFIHEYKNNNIKDMDLSRTTQAVTGGKNTSNYNRPSRS